MVDAFEHGDEGFLDAGDVAYGEVALVELAVFDALADDAVDCLDEGVVGDGGGVVVEADCFAGVAVAGGGSIERACLGHCADGGFYAVGQHEYGVFFGLRLGARIAEIVGVGGGVGE